MRRQVQVAAASAAAAVLFVSAGCSKKSQDERRAAPSEPSKPVVLFVGDSLTAGYGIALEEAFPALLDERWRAAKRPYAARNAGVSGATSAGVLENLDWTLAPDVRAVFVCVGANDGLRGLDLAATKRNVSKIVEKARAKRLEVVLAGMRIPPNYGKDYAERFAAIFPSVAAERGVKLMPFLLDGVAGRPELNLPDGIHPNEEGHRRLADTVEAFFEKERLFR